MSISRINNNVASLRAMSNLNTVGNQLSRNIERLSSGLRINRAGDDAVGLTIRERLRTQIRGTDQAIQNSQNGINMVNTTEASLDSLVSSLQRIRELTIQAANTGSNDGASIQAIQDEIFQQIDEVNRIANTARFSTRQLLTGDNANVTQIKKGQDDLGVRISPDPNASNLKSGVSFLQITQTVKGDAKLLPDRKEDGQAIFATGIQDATDIAVTVARFEDMTGAPGTAAGGATALNDVLFDGISLEVNDIIAFQGVLSDGVTPFSGAISVFAGATLQDLNNQLQLAIDNAEVALFGGIETNIPGSFIQTHVNLPDAAADVEAGSGRFRFLSAQANSTTTTSLGDAVEALSKFDVTFSVINGNGDLRARTGATRDWVAGERVGGQIGNLVNGITGSTFKTGNFEIEVTDIIPPVRRRVEMNLAFRFSVSGTAATRDVSLASPTNPVIINGTFVDGLYTVGRSGIALSENDTITIQGTNKDGTTFESIFTVSLDPNDDVDFGNGLVATLGGLIDSINYRDRTRGVNGPLEQSAFENAKATLTGNGTIMLIDDIGDFSESNFYILINDSESTATVPDQAKLVNAGNPEEATISIDGGPRKRVVVGDHVELEGPESTKFGEAARKLTMRIGGGFRDAMDQSIMNGGVDTAKMIGSEFVGRLNSGPAVTFQNGDTSVFFESGFSESVAETILLDFDAILDVTGPDIPNTGMLILLSTVNNALNFQVGPFKGQDLQFSIPDMRADNLGFGRGSGRTVIDINVTTVEGANEALAIVDKALDQVSRTRSVLGAFTNRMEGALSNLSVSSVNLSTSESRFSDVDITDEVTRYTSNQIIFQAGTSVLAQANSLPQGLLSLLG